MQLLGIILFVLIGVGSKVAANALFSCRLYGQVYYLYNQDEIAWGHVMFAARVMGMICVMFKDPDGLYPWWLDQKNPEIHFSHQKIDGAILNSADFVAMNSHCLPAAFSFK
jgi:hypothetical protein